MALRSNESPMEFEYDNKNGTMDPTSPFAQLSQQRNYFNNQTVPRGFGSKIVPASPTRNPTFAVPHLPKTPKNHVAGFRDRIDTDFSSAAESSPDQADGEETPEPRWINLNNVTMFRGTPAIAPSKSPVVAKKGFLEKLRSSHHTSLIKRAHKRKRYERDYNNDQSASRRSSADSACEDNSRPSSSEGLPRSSSSAEKSSSKKASQAGLIPSILTFIHSHPHLPTILAYYGQTVFAWAIVGAVIYLAYSFWAAVRQDVDLKAEEYSLAILNEISICARQFVQNHCGTEMGAPALQEACDEWNRCQNQDYKAIGRARVSAHTFAEILNSFIEPLSYKFLGFCLVVVLVITVIPNALFGYVRRANEQSLQQQQAPFPPQTPNGQRYGGFGSEQYFTPQTQQRHLDFNASGWGSPSKRPGGRDRSPVKSIAYH